MSPVLRQARLPKHRQLRQTCLLQPPQHIKCTSDIALNHRSRTIVHATAESPFFLKHIGWLERGLADVPPSPFAELGLDKLQHVGSGPIRHRNYSVLTDPRYQDTPEGFDWSRFFGDPTRPLYIDVGCGAGRYVLLLAKQKGPEANVLGIDIHAALMHRANGWAQELGLVNAHYLTGNASLLLEAVLQDYPGPVACVSVQYPDPHVHRQRHVVQKDFALMLASRLPAGADVFLASDFEDTAAYMRDVFECHTPDAFTPSQLHTSTPTIPCTPYKETLKLLEAALAQLKRAEEDEQARGEAGEDERAGAGSSPKSTASSSSGGSSSSSEATGRDATSAASSSVPSGGPNSNKMRVYKKRKASSDRSLDSPLARLPYPHTHPKALEASVRVAQEGLTPSFERTWDQAGWLLDNPLGSCTEREAYVQLHTRDKVYRAMLVRR